ncbi:MAG: DNA mismatch repair protein MutS, partial [Clostridia bacterium]|nr:DNA mismatch repair protein MutS [Clostridia bacterium]
NAVVGRAKQILAELEETAGADRPKRPSGDSGSDEGEISFANLSADAAVEKLRSTDLNMLSPYEAMTMLFELKKMVD